MEISMRILCWIVHWWGLRDQVPLSNRTRLPPLWEIVLDAKAKFRSEVKCPRHYLAIHGWHCRALIKSLSWGLLQDQHLNLGWSNLQAWLDSDLQHHYWCFRFHEHQGVLEILWRLNSNHATPIGLSTRIELTCVPSTIERPKQTLTAALRQLFPGCRRFWISKTCPDVSIFPNFL